MNALELNDKLLGTQPQTQPVQAAKAEVATSTEPTRFTLIGRKPTLGDNLVAVAFALVTMGLLWLVWDQQRLLY